MICNKVEVNMTEVQDPVPLPTDLEALRGELAEHGRVTQHRLSCLRVLRESDEHLAPVDLLDRVRAELPTVRPSTVYRTIATFLDSGLAHQVEGARALRYGAGPGHAHAVCLRCEQIQDIDPLAPGVVAQLDGAAGAARLVGLTMHVLCARCTDGDPVRWVSPPPTG
jgi:Fe2+ or Zn2+ uptake regulation protein